MFDFLRRLFGRNRPGAPRRQAAHARAPQPPDDPELRQILDRIDRKWADALHQERTAEALLTPRERIKKRLNLPTELPADYRADQPVPVLSPARIGSPVPMIVVVNNVGIGLNMPRALFEYLYRQCPLAAEDQRVINESLAQWGLELEAFETG
jgi:hypothetical protein